MDWAIRQGDIAALRQALDEGSDPNGRVGVSSTLLMLAANYGQVAIGKLLIERGADINTRDAHGWTALSVAMHGAHPRFVSMLLAAGASGDGHPFGSSMDDFLMWEEKYSSNTPATMRRIRELLTQSNHREPHSA